MSAAKKVASEVPPKAPKFKVARPQMPSEQALKEAKKALGVRQKANHKLSRRKLKRFDAKLGFEPTVAAGAKN